MADLDEVLDRDGNWEVRVTIYRNGKKVGTADATGNRFYGAAYNAWTRMDTGEVDEHVPRDRRIPNEVVKPSRWRVGLDSWRRRGAWPTGR